MADSIQHHILTNKTQRNTMNYTIKVMCTAILCCATCMQAQEKIIFISAENPWEENKNDYPVVISTKNIKCDFPIISSTVYDGEIEIPSQVDDLDHDGAGDEIAFVTDMSAKTKKIFKVVLSSEESSANRYTPRVYADMKIYDKSNKREKHQKIHSLTIPGTSNVYNNLYHHGPAFESELVAYRIYFDKKQTVDIYGKFNKGFEVEPSGWYPDDDQLAAGFGDDVLRVSGSCGMGALKGWNSKNKKATHIEPVSERTGTILAYGPVRTVVDMSVRGWKYGDSRLNMTCRYTLYGGHRDVQVDVIFDKPLDKEIFCTGVQDIKGSTSYSDHQGLIGCWGRDWPVNDTVKYAKETVGLGTYIPKKYIAGETKDKANYLYQVQAPGKSVITYYITFSSMKENFGYKTPETWFEYLKTWKEDINRPCKIKILKKNK